MRGLGDSESILLPGAPLASLEAYLAVGGGEGLRRAFERSPDEVVEEVKRSGLRGRGGAGFPTGVKWETVRRDPCSTAYVVCNAAEGEPGTFKDRWLLRRNPYQVLEGVAIAAYAVSAERAFVALKASFQPELSALRRALSEMRPAGLLGDVPIEVVTGPEDYLYGEEKALLEVIEGRPPLPRILPPFQVGLFATRASHNPTVMNNAETLANVPPILRTGAAFYRSVGTAPSPGTMLFTICGDIRRPGVYELPLGVSLSHLVYGLGGGPPDGRQVKAVFPGASNPVLMADRLDTPLTFETMHAAGSGLGSGGFVVYDDSACIVDATAAFSRFLYTESCGQCPACKQNSRKITECLERIERGTGSQDDLDTTLGKCDSVTGGRRCGLPLGEALLVRSAVEAFGDEFTAHLGRRCPFPRRLPFPKLVDFDEEAGRFLYAGRFVYKVQGRPEEPDWVPAEEPVGDS